VATNIGNLAIRLVMLILLVSVVLDSASTFAQSDTPLPAINVLVLDYSAVSPSVLAAAERETSRIFAQAGLRFQWTDCPVRHSSDLSSACEDEPVTGQIRVRILPRHLNHNFPDSVFGFVVAPTYASVYYESALRLVQTVSDASSNISVILGCLMAHEIGHLLLGQGQHTVSGIMQPSWDIQQVQLALRGRLGFSSQQARRMRQSTVFNCGSNRGVVARSND
jgi:hypothetical protein